MKARCQSLLLIIASLPRAEEALVEVLGELRDILEYYSKEKLPPSKPTVVGSFKNNLNNTVKLKPIPFEEIL